MMQRLYHVVTIPDGITDVKLLQLSVDFDGNVVSYEAFEFEALALACAITIYRSQGSEFPAVVVPILNSTHIMLQRNLHYAAITRARRLVVLVGDPKTLAVAVRNDKVLQRYTALAARLRQSACGQAATGF
jgi:exodeoxyribonuclease V alpha subunit